MRSYYQGWFELQTAEQLFRKVAMDFERFKQEPTNSYLAFNFFVTAYHLLEWQYPNDKNQRTKLKKTHPILDVCRDLSVGAKHFRPTSRMDSVNTTHREGGAFSSGFGQDFDVGDLKVSLSGNAASEYGNPVDAIELAREAMVYWRGEFQE